MEFGRGLRLEVSVDAWPPARFAWYQDQRPLLTSVEGNRCILSLDQAERGEYRVVATNAAGSAVSSVRVEVLGRPVTHFCYPSGDYDPVFFPWLHELGVESATTCDVGIAKAESNLLLLPRFVDTMTQPDVLFESWCSGAGAVLSRGGA